MAPYHRALWLYPAVCAMAAIGFAQDDGILRHDDDQPDGLWSVAGNGYATVFTRPDDAPLLQSVWLHASQYGRREARDLALVVTDIDLNPIAVTGLSQEPLQFGEDRRWTEFRLPVEVRPPEHFAILVYAHCLQDRGISLSLDGTTPDAHCSYLVRPGEAPTLLERDGQPYNWMVRCTMGAEFVPPEDGTVQLAHDNGTADQMQSFGDSAQVVKFTTPDDGIWLVNRVLVSGAFYGMPNDGAANQFEVHILDPAGESVATALFRYDEFYRSGTPSWASLPIPDVAVSGDFYVLTNMHSRQTPGVYVGYSTACEGDFSMISRNGALTEWTPNVGDPATTNWCIRCEVRPEE